MKEVAIVVLPSVASVPGDHPYVRALRPQADRPGFVVLPDPPVAGAGPGQWWPSPVLTPAWLRAHAASVDVVHVHFGFEHLTAGELHAVTQTLHTLDLPLVLTVHDLQNPHLVDQAPHEQALDVLVPAAATVLTLTPGAAAEIGQRWGRRVVVVAHPPLAPLGHARPQHTGLRVGLHTTSRANNAAAAVRPELVSALAAIPGARLVDAPPARLSDADLWQHLAGLDVLVLPYRFGTHSGFVEACADLGTTVVAARTGFLHEQQPVVGFDLDRPGALTQALHAALDRPAVRPDPAARHRQQREAHRLHAELYAGLSARVAA